MLSFACVQTPAVRRWLPPVQLDRRPRESARDFGGHVFSTTSIPSGRGDEGKAGIDLSRAEPQKLTADLAKGRP